MTACPICHASPVRPSGLCRECEAVMRGEG
jgi:hypothetical protein